MNTIDALSHAGVRGDGLHDDTAGLQAALDSGASVVRLPTPPACYTVSRTLVVHSGQTLSADRDAVIRLADRACVPLLTNADHCDRSREITVRGGVWDGNNPHNPRGEDGDRAGYTGTVLDFVRVSGLVLGDLTVRNPEAFSVRLGEVEDFRVEDLVFDHPATRPNQDGVHVGGFSRRGVIRNLRALTPLTTNDDMVALNADDDVERVINQGMKRGPIREITVAGVHAPEAYTFVRLLSVTELIEDIAISDVTGGCRLHAVNMDNWRFPVGVGNIRNVLLRNFTVRKVPWRDGGSTGEWARSAPLVTIRLAVDGLRLENLRREPADDLPAATLVLDNGRPNRVHLEGAEGTVEGDRFAVERGGFAALMIGAPQGQE